MRAPPSAAVPVSALVMVVVLALVSPGDAADDAHAAARRALGEFDAALHTRTEPAVQERLRDRLAALDRDALGTGLWLDLHVAIATLDRRLEPPPAVGLADGRVDPAETSDDPFDIECRSAGLSASGRARFAHELRHRHGLALSPEAVLRLGEAGRRLTARNLEQHAVEFGEGRSWHELVVQSRDVHPTSLPDLVRTCEKLVRETTAAVESSGLISLPTAALGLPVRAAGRTTAHPFAAYQPATTTSWGRREAQLTLPPIPPRLSAEGADAWLRDFDVHALRLVAAHEGVPGHHLQHTRAKRVRSRIRAHGFNSTFVEGWAFYAEGLLERAGGLDGPMDRLAVLRMEAWRATRCYVDPALHLGRIAPSEAVRLLIEEGGLSRRAARMDVRAILRRPASAFGYWVGRLLIRNLRDEYVRRNGPGTEREFHDRLLSFGSIPIPLIEAVLLERRPSYDALHP